MPRRRRPSGFLLLAVCLALGACASKRLALPTDPGSPLPDFAQIHEQISSACRGARTVTAELALSGRAGDQKLRGRVVFGFERPSSLRLEGVAPFGPPAFVLVARERDATLLLPRDQRVVRGAEPQAILGALTGVTLTPAELGAILTGCVTVAPRATAGRLHANGWASIDLDGGASVYLQRQQGTWSVTAARRGDWQIEYAAWQGGFPRQVRLRSDTPAPVDVAAGISQLEVNVDLEASAFSVTVPPDMRPLSVDELRQSGPLRGQP
jgi:outer membrane biogenesis lipoprotein LolB